MFANCCCVFHTRKLEFANTSFVLVLFILKLNGDTRRALVVPRSLLSLNVKLKPNRFNFCDGLAAMFLRFHLH